MTLLTYLSYICRFFSLQAGARREQIDKAGRLPPLGGSITRRYKLTVSSWTGRRCNKCSSGGVKATRNDCGGRRQLIVSVDSTHVIDQEARQLTTRGVAAPTYTSATISSNSGRLRLSALVLVLVSTKVILRHCYLLI